ncbi:hypothetical protein HAX54_001317 [Datura stramonium]|uniref:Uncharacterized protein n=1 Tax=Datura stramonium TaxID=4076 RepID=A0ABS8RSF2_DATST|nr:hypothetical protein [Datura stramonium]
MSGGAFSKLLNRLAELLNTGKSPPAESSLTDILEDVRSLPIYYHFQDVNVWNECLSYIIHGVRTFSYAFPHPGGMRWNFLVKLKLHRCTAAPLQHWQSLDGDMRRSFKAGCVDPKVLLELFSVYRQWQEEKAKKICKRQEEIENKIEVADALAVKLHQRFNSTLFRNENNLTASIRRYYYCQFLEPEEKRNAPGNHWVSYNVELGVLKGRLTEVISNCDALCKRIDAEGPESLRSSIKPFTAAASSDTGSNSSSIHILQAETDEKQ